jgi:hypothetical protein
MLLLVTSLSRHIYYYFDFIIYAVLLAVGIYLLSIRGNPLSNAEKHSIKVIKRPKLIHLENTVGVLCGQDENCGSKTCLLIIRRGVSGQLGQAEVCQW